MTATEGVAMSETDEHEHTPTTQDIRDRAIRGTVNTFAKIDAMFGFDSEKVASAEFDRWLAAHDVEVRAQPQDEPSDAQVNAAFAVLLEDHKGSGAMVMIRPDVIREALRAAMATS